MFLRAVFLFEASTLLFVRPTKRVQSRQASSSQCGTCPSETRWSSFAAKPGLVPATLLSTPHTRVRLPISSNRPLWCFRSIFFTSCGLTTLMSTTACPRTARCPLWPWEAKVAGFAHDRSCKPSHRSPCLYFRDLLPPSSPSAHLHALPHLLLVAFSFAPNCFVLDLKSTPHVSTLCARPTPFLLLHSWNFSSR